MMRVVAAVITLAVFSIPNLARAETPASCLTSYEGAQRERLAHHLLRARQLLVACGAESCPSALRKDCIEWLSEVDRQTPSIVVRAQRDAVVVVDGSPLANDATTGGVPLDPGPHRVEVKRAGTSVVQEIVLRGGEKLVAVDFTQPAALKPARPAEPGPPGAIIRTRPLPWYTWGGIGASAVLLGGGAVFGAYGFSGKSGLEECSPICSRDRIDDVEQRFLIGDVLLGTGLVAAVVTTVLVLTRPEHVATMTARKNAAAFVFPIP